MSLSLMKDIKIQLCYIRSALTTAELQSGRHNIVLGDVLFFLQWIPIKPFLTQMYVIIHHVDRNVCTPVFYKADFVLCFYRVFSNSGKVFNEIPIV